jgi:hypothetical protein
MPRNHEIGKARNAGFEEGDLTNPDLQSRNLDCTPKYYSFVEELEAERRERTRPEDITQILANQDEKAYSAVDRNARQRARNEKQIEAERVAAQKL